MAPVGTTVMADSSIWIDYFGGKVSEATDMLDDLLCERRVVLGDIILTEVLQGFRHAADLEAARRTLTKLSG